MLHFGYGRFLFLLNCIKSIIFYNYIIIMDFASVLIEFIKFKNYLIEYFYNHLEKRNMLLVNDLFYYLWFMYLFFNRKINKKIMVSYIYDSTKYSTVYCPRDFAHLNSLHNNFIIQCVITNNTFGRKKTNIYSIVDNMGNDYKYIVKLLPPKKIFLDYHTCDFFIEECENIDVMFMINNKKTVKSYMWNDIKEKHIYNLLELN
jgi:hypothetical protein